MLDYLRNNVRFEKRVALVVDAFIFNESIMPKSFSPASKNRTIHDESLFTGLVTEVYHPSSAEEVKNVILDCINQQEKVTIYGSLTGLCGAGVPLNGCGLNMSKLCGIEYIHSNNTVRAGGGALFSDIDSVIAKESCLSRVFPISPTEKQSTVAGAISLNSCSPKSKRYGELRNYIAEITICDGCGNLRTLHPGDFGFNEVFGFEGMLGVITEAVLYTVPVYQASWELLFFFSGKSQASEFCSSVKEISSVTTLNYYDETSLLLLDSFRDNNESVKALPVFPSAAAAVGIELEADNYVTIERDAELLLSKCEEVGGNADLAYVATDDSRTRISAIPHLITECCNMKTSLANSADSVIRKLSLAVSLKNEYLYNIIKIIQEKLPADCCTPVVYGSVCGGTLYITFLPNNSEEYALCQTFATEIATSLSVKGCGIFTSCGVGKLYRELFSHILPTEAFIDLSIVKNSFDPHGLFNPGNMFMGKDA